MFFYKSINLTAKSVLRTQKNQKTFSIFHKNRIFNQNNHKHLCTITTGGDDRSDVVVVHNSIENKKKILPYKDIPRARRLPFIGTSLEFLLSGSGKNFYKYIDKRHNELGPIFREPVGAIEAIFISDPNMMRQMYMHEGKYPRNCLPEAWLLYNSIHGCKRGLLFMEGEEWLENRKIMNLLLLRNNFQLAQTVVEQTCDDIIRNWDRLLVDNNFIVVPNLMTDLYSWSINVLIRLMLGNTSNDKIQQINYVLPQFSQNVSKIMEKSVPFMAVRPTLAKKFNLRIWKDFENCVTATMNIVDEIMEIALKDNHSDDGGLVNEMLDKGMSPLTIKRLFADMIIAAGDTTSYSTQWALYLLSNNIQTQNDIRENLANYEGDFESPLVRGAVREALRLYPIANFICRFLQTDAIIGNYEIKKDSLLISSMYTSGRDEKNFPQPTNYMPSRWLRDSSSGKLQEVLQPHGMMPYAMGLRTCVGKKIANLMMHTLITKILQSFHLKLMNENQIEITSKLILVPSEPIQLGIKKAYYN